MMGVLNCIAFSHNLSLVALAAITCVAGTLVTFRLYWRTMSANPSQKFGWLFLTSLSGGSSIWSTHFIAMLGYQPDVPVTFDPVMTIGSLFIAIFGSGFGFVISTYRLTRQAPLVGGAIVGLSISAMHFTGMFAYRPSGLITWNNDYIAASIGLAVVLSAAAFAVGEKPNGQGRRWLAKMIFVLGVVSLHFTAMTALKVTPLTDVDGAIDTAAFTTMALAIALICLLVTGAGLSSHLIDATSRSQSDEHIRHLAQHDFLTGLPNRMSFNAAVDSQIAAVALSGRRLAIVGIDLNDFKEVNDGWGHSAGDRTLQHFAMQLRRAEADGGFVARIGGDEFAAVKAFESDAELDRFVRRLERNLVNGRPSDDSVRGVGASIGIALYPKDGATRESLINNADLAMYRAKADSAHRLQFYDPAMGEAVRSRRILADELRLAMKNNDLSLHYQPQISLATNCIIGFEALCRWNHARDGYISPAVFIPLAEETGLILELGEWVLREACAEAATWRSDHRIAINLSAAQFSHPNLPQLIDEVLLATGLPPARLELELTETAVLADTNRSLVVIRQIKAMGVAIALDDFGTGFSSLSTLSNFPFDKIKLDHSFIERAENDVRSLAIVRAVVTLGKSLGIPVLAEGIETERQLELLRAECCDEAQGYLLGLPMPAADLATSVDWPASVLWRTRKFIPYQPLYRDRA